MKTRALPLLAWLLLAAEASAQTKHSATGCIEIRTPTVITAPIVHRGTIKITDTLVSFAAPYTELGAYVSDPSDNYFADLSVGPTGYLTGGVGDRWIISGNFTNNSTQNTLWSTEFSELDFDAGMNPHVFALAGADVRTSFFGLISNFAWGILRLRSGQGLVLSDGNGTAGAALYASRVTLDNGIAQVSNITGNGFSIYYDPTDSGNNYLLTGAPGGVYNLTGGGVLAPLIPEMKIVSITRLPNGHAVLQCIGVPNHTTRVEVSSTCLTGTFVPLISVNVDATANFTIDDATAVGQTKRFYRLAFP